MADRSNHYEVAFESFLRALKVSCLPIDETRRTFTAGEEVKSLDFVVTQPDGRTLVVDVKGRTARGSKPTLENWIRQDDVEGLRRWRIAFGASAGVLAFVYRLSADANRKTFADLFEYGDRLYGCLAIDVEDYASLMRPRSSQWGTYSVPQEAFRASGRPFTAWLSAAR